MIRLRPLALMVLLTVLRLKAATVTGLVQNITLEAPTNAPMVFTPPNPSYDNGRLTTDTAKGVRVGSNGSFRVDLAAGEYLLTIGTSTKRVKLTVPTGTDTYDLISLVSTNTPFSTNNPSAPFELKVNKGVANGYASLDSDGLVPLAQLPDGIGGGGSSGGVGSFYTNGVLATSSATQLGATNGTNTAVSAVVAGSRVTFTFNAIPPRVSAGSGIFVTNQGGTNFIVAGSITAAEFTALTNAVAGLTNLNAAKMGTNDSIHYGYLRMPRTNDYIDFGQTWNVQRYADNTLHFDYPDVAATPLLIRPNGITVSNIYIPGTNVFIQWNGTWSLVAWADGSFRLLNDDTGTTPFSVGTDGTVTAPAFVGDGSGLTGLPGLSGLSELHFENESGTPAVGDAVVYRYAGRIWIQDVGGVAIDLEGVATTATTAANAASAAWTTNAAQQVAVAGLTNIANSRSVALSNLSYAIGTAATNYTDARAVALSNLAYVIGANGTNYTDSRAVALSNLSYAIGTASTNYANARAVALSNLAYLIGANGTNYTDSRIPTLVTNTVWVDAGAMRAYVGSTAEGGRSAPSTGTFTNGAYAADTWDFDDTTNECAGFSMAMGPAFAGIAKVSLHWLTTNTINGASNVVWEAAAGVMATNNAFSSYLYSTNTTMRFWSSNSLQITTLPTLTLTNYLPRNRIEWRIGRLGTNSNDEAVGDVRLLGAEISVVSTNYMGGF